MVLYLKNVSGNAKSEMWSVSDGVNLPKLPLFLYIKSAIYYWRRRFRKYQYRITLAEIASCSVLFLIWAIATLLFHILLTTSLIVKGLSFISLNCSQFKWCQLSQRTQMSSMMPYILALISGVAYTVNY